MINCSKFNPKGNRVNVSFSVFITIFGVTFFTACKKDSGTPECGYVNYTIYTSEPTFINLNAIGGWTYIGGGCKGIIVYRRSQDEFLAYERTCTFDPDNNCPGVSVDGNNINMTDTCCGSQFQIFDGNVTKGPASRMLQQYRTTFDGSVLQVFN